MKRPVRPVGVPGSIEPRTAAKRRRAGLIVGVQLRVVIVGDQEQLSSR